MTSERQRQRELGRLLGQAARERITLATVAAHPHITISFPPDGESKFYPEGDDRPELARRLTRLVQILHEHPEAIRCAAGACDGTCRHARLKVQA